MNSSELRPALALAVLVLTACSGPNTPEAAKTEAKTEPAAPAGPVSALTALPEMNRSARAWSSDEQVLTVEAKTGFENQSGQAAIWEATFGSTKMKQYAKFSYAVTAIPPDVPQGVTAAGAVPWAGPTRTAEPFDSRDVQIDSDAAFKEAMTKAGPWLKEHPAIKLTRVSLGASDEFPGPVWYFLWGDKKLGFYQLVSGTTGKVLK